MTTITIDRATVEQALEALEKYRKMMFVEAGCRFGEGDAAITNLRAAMAQQVEPDHETRAELAEQQVVQLAEERDHYRNLWQKAQEQAEPLNLSDPAIQKRLAAQWGYVPAAQAEPVEPVAWLAPDGSVRETPAAKSFGEWVWGPDDFRPLYTAPPQRKLVPLTEGEIDALPWFGSPRQFARAVEKASWEKNHGQA